MSVQSVSQVIGCLIFAAILSFLGASAFSTSLQSAACLSNFPFSRCNQDVSWYRSAKYVFRNYYCAETLRTYPNAYYVPAGWHNSANVFDDDAMLIPAQDRRFAVTFIGSIRADRKTMLNEFVDSGYALVLLFGTLT